MASFTAVWVQLLLVYAAFTVTGMIVNFALLASLFRRRKEGSVLCKALASLTVANLVSDLSFTVTQGLLNYRHFRTPSWTLALEGMWQLLKSLTSILAGILIAHILLISAYKLISAAFQSPSKLISTFRFTVFVALLTWATPPVLLSTYCRTCELNDVVQSYLSYAMVAFGMVLTVQYVWILYRLDDQFRLDREIPNTAGGPQLPGKHLNAFNQQCMILVVTYGVALAAFDASIGAQKQSKFPFNNIPTFIALKSIINPYVIFHLFIKL